jgi:hypothetical protein
LWYLPLEEAGRAPRTLLISSSTVDRPLFDPIGQALEVDAQKDGTWRVSQDNRAIPAGSEWESELYDALYDTAVVVAFLSTPYFNSRWCRIERETARDTVFAPVLARECPWAGHPDVARRQVLRGPVGRAIKDEDNQDLAHTHVAAVVETVLRALNASFGRRSLEGVVRRVVALDGAGPAKHDFLIRGNVEAARAEGGLEASGQRRSRPSIPSLRCSGCAWTGRTRVRWSWRAPRRWTGRA